MEGGHRDGRPASHVMYVHAFSDIFMRGETVDTVSEKAYLVRRDNRVVVP
eukprot:COSAG06_NODE_4799_length_3945_cov_8.420376_8_plen_50_part_00